jgi:hypothetical protein
LKRITVGANLLERKTKPLSREAGGRKISFALCAQSDFTNGLKRAAGERTDVLLVSWAEMNAGW